MCFFFLFCFLFIHFFFRPLCPYSFYFSTFPHHHLTFSSPGIHPLCLSRSLIATGNSRTGFAPLPTTVWNAAPTPQNQSTDLTGMPVMKRMATTLTTTTENSRPTSKLASWALRWRYPSATADWLSVRGRVSGCASTVTRPGRASW